MFFVKCNKPKCQAHLFVKAEVYSTEKQSTLYDVVKAVKCCIGLVDLTQNTFVYIKFFTIRKYKKLRGLKHIIKKTQLKNPKDQFSSSLLDRKVVMHNSFKIFWTLVI